MVDSCPKLTVGVMAVQGAFLEHQVALERAAEQLSQRPLLTVREVRHADDITSDIQGLIIPGGESTTMSLFLRLATDIHKCDINNKY